MKHSLVGILSLGLTLVPVPSIYGAVGDWTIYPSCGSFWRIEELGAKYYLVTGNTLVEADTANLSDLTTLTRLDGLNGNTVSDIIAAGHLNKLAIIYQDGNIDFLNTDNEISNLPDFANYSVTGDRTISGIGISNDSLCIRTGFGGIVVDMKQELIKSTLYSDYEQDAAALARCRAIVAARTTSSELKQVMNSIQPVNGNQTTLAAQMVFMNGRLYAAQSTYNDYVNYNWGTATISVLDVATGEWKSVSADRLTPMVKAIDSNGSFRELTAIAPDPNDPDLIYACSLEGGIYRIEGDSLTGYYNAHLNPDGMVSLLKDNESRKTRYTRVGAMYVDDNGYLWFTNGDSESEYTLRCLTPDTTFFLCPTKNFTGYASGQFGIIGRLTPTTVTVGSNTYNFKWMTRTFHINSAAVCIHYDGGTPYDPSDDQSSMFTSITDQDGNVYNPTYFRDLKEDKNGVIWLLTSIGPFVIENQISCFNNPGTVKRIKIPRNDGTNLADYLLGGVSCRCMVVDNANRKWIGTDGAGLYLLSEDGLTQLEHFTTENSPLYADQISSLAYDSNTGTLYIGAGGAICAYETDVLLSVEDNKGVYCYPNPVRPDYSGKLNILGFKDGSMVTITDVTHHVVFRTKSDGSIIHWDLNGNDGKRVRPGVYFIEAIEEGGKKGGIFKFLVL
jgi:hypothetical protein